MAGRRGWKWDAANNRLSVYVDGTEVARFDDATDDLRLLVNGLTIDAGGLTVTADGLTVTAGGLTVTAGGITCTGATSFADKLSFSDQVIHAYAKVETIAAAKTLDAEDVGKVFECATDGTIFTLPATAAGLTFTIVNTGADGAVGLQASPAAVDKIMGPDSAGVDDKDWINTKATAKKGDMVRLVADGSLGYYVVDQHGTWAAQA